MALDCYVQIKNIQGESAAENHEDWIACDAFSLSASSRSGDSTELRDFTFSHRIDKASPKLAMACCTDEDLEEVVVHLVEEGNVYMEYTLLPGTKGRKDANVLRVTSVTPAGDDNTKGRPSETVTIGYGKIVWKYTEGNIEGEYDASLS
jgi:type VI secretion system secreted protein Hcp